MAEGGDDAVLMAMDIGERATNAEYAEALQLDVDERCKAVLQRNFDDEQRHLSYIEGHVPGWPGAAGGVPR